jgi:hypothetical protein
VLNLELQALSVARVSQPRLPKLKARRLTKLEICIVLLSPPLTSGTRTTNAVRRAAQILGYSELRIVNLLAAPTQNLEHVVELGVNSRLWVDSRPQLAKGLETANCLLFGWGLLRALRSARTAAENQVVWLLDHAAGLGHRAAWSVGEDVRHPSRWHQYTADKHARTGGGTPDERLRAVLAERPLPSYRPGYPDCDSATNHRSDAKGPTFSSRLQLP